MIDSKGLVASVSRFVQQHPMLSLQTAVPLSLARAMATDGVVLDKYFDMLENCQTQNTTFDKPGAIFNFDETGLPLNPKYAKVLQCVGTKNPSFVTGGDKYSGWEGSSIAHFRSAITSDFHSKKTW